MVTLVVVASSCTLVWLLNERASMPARLMAIVRGIARETTLAVGVTYFRPGLDCDYILELFQVALGEVEEKVGDETIIIGGDFNARPGVSDSFPRKWSIIHVCTAR